MHEQPGELGKTIQDFLHEALPRVSHEYWDNCVCVVACLTFQQQRIVEEEGVSPLAELDLLWP